MKPVSSSDPLWTNPVLTMQQRVIPATIGVEPPLSSSNAHPVSSSPIPDARTEPTPTTRQFMPMAIVGMDVHMGDCDNLDNFYLSVLLGRQHFSQLPPERWKGLDKLHQTWADAGLPAISELRGAWIKDDTIDSLRSTIQPKEADGLTHQQLLMLKVAAQAMQDAQLDQRQYGGANVAVIIATETDTLKGAVFLDDEEHLLSEHTASTSNDLARRIAAWMDFTGPAFTVSAKENGVYEALKMAQNVLTNHEVEAVVLGAIDWRGGLEHVLARQAAHPIHTGVVSMSWNCDSQGWVIGEGAGAIVLKRADKATTDRVYAQIDDLDIVQSEWASVWGAVNAEAVARAVNRVLNRQRVSPSKIGYLEVSASGFSDQDGAEIAGLTRAYGVDKAALTCALGSSKAHIGHTFSAAGMASIIKTALSLYHRFLPGVPNWKGPLSAELFGRTPFYVPDVSRPWIPEKDTVLLRAAINGLATDGTSAHVLLSEGSHPQTSQSSVYLTRGGERLFPLQATTPDGLLPQLTQIENGLAASSFRCLSDQLCAAYKGASPTVQTLVMVASSDKELKQEIQFFRAKLAKDDGPNASLQTPSGSYYTPKPLGLTGKLALVYPGSGSAYVGAGTTIFQAFPVLYDRLRNEGYNPTDVLNAALYPRSLFALSPAEKQLKERQLQTDASAMMLISSSFSGLFTKILEDYLAVRADSLLGYSLGEASAMWYSQGIWSTTAVEANFIQSPLFQEKVGGRMRLLAELWQLPEAQARARWASRLIYLPRGMPGYDSLADWFRREVAPLENRVFLTFINTDTEIILSGDSLDLDRVLDTHRLTAVPLMINNVVHHDFCRRVSDELIQLHQLPIERTTDKRFYSSVAVGPLAVNSHTLAHNALEVCCQTVNWPRIVRKLAADNHTLFIEVGANATCSRWIADILQGQEHAVLPMDRKGSSVLRNLTGLVARLLAHGVPVNLAPFFEPETTEPTPRQVTQRTLDSGSPRFEPLLPAPEDKQRVPPKMGRMEPLKIDPVHEGQASSRQPNTDLQLRSSVESSNAIEVSMIFPNLSSESSPPNGLSSSRKPVTTKWFGNRQDVHFDESAIRRVFDDLDQTCFCVRDAQGRIGVATTMGTTNPSELSSMELLATLPAFGANQLGDPLFRQAYGTQYNYMAGAMANGIASEELVIALGKAGMLASFGAGGLAPSRIEKAIETIQQALPNGPYAFNLIHSPAEEALESKAVELYLKKGVTIIEASAFLGLTEHVVRYRAAGLSRRSDGTIQLANRIIAKVSRLEVATVFLKPAPDPILRQLVEAGRITAKQAQLATTVPMADDITVEADSGGHTDKRSLVCLLPAVLALRDQIQTEQNYAQAIRIGAAGGISTPESVAGAFAMGASYVVTGSVNQSCRESGTSDQVRSVLAQVDMADVIMAPAADMFEMGVKLQVAKRGTLFALRAQKLYDLYLAHPSWEAIPDKEKVLVEKSILGEAFEAVWTHCLTFFAERDPEQILLANNNPKRKLALVFRWYLGLSSVWANQGVVGRELDYQIWCGPAMGAFNQWAKGSRLEKWENREVADVALQLLTGAAYLTRLHMLALLGIYADRLYKSVPVTVSLNQPHDGLLFV